MHTKPLAYGYLKTTASPSPMHITLDQARALDAVARLGTIQQAAKALNRGHSAVLYLIHNLEEQTGLKLFDRQGYRNKLNAHGEVIHRYCQELLTTEENLRTTCDRLRNNWEPQIQLIYDGVIDFNIIADAIKLLHQHEIPSEIKILASFLGDVENEFKTRKADLMVTIMPIKLPEVQSISLPSIDMYLVAQRNHPLHKIRKGQISTEVLRQHTCIFVRETTNGLGLSTERLQLTSTISVNDFPTKREAIMRGLGFGWLPGYLIQKQLKNGDLKIIKCELDSHHKFYPKLYHRHPELIGQGTKNLLKFFTGRT